MKSYLYVKTCTFQQKWTKKKLYLFVNFDVKSCFLLQSVFPYLCVCAPKFPPPPPDPLCLLASPRGAPSSMGCTCTPVGKHWSSCTYYQWQSCSSMVNDHWSAMISSYIGQRSWPDWSCQLADLEWVCLLYAVISGTHVHVHPYPGAEYTYQIWSPLKINTKFMSKVGKTNSNQSNA